MTKGTYIYRGDTNYNKHLDQQNVLVTLGMNIDKKGKKKGGATLINHTQQQHTNHH
jgi:hypothetical protein